MKILIKNRQRHKPLNKTKLTKTARNILSLLEQPTAELSILFVGDRKMLQLNNDYRGIKKSTDVLSFEAQLPLNHSEAGNILGDVVINVARAESQAEAYGTGFYDEIYHLLIHGVLHLSGYEHENSRYRAGKMRKKEEEIFDAVKKMDSKH
ncbi:MAG TPA: rRNA maturation RNase YbeY [Nitrospirae bacterium]|nr:endoribonuclease YbeY [bacterium BMS3Abin06]HDH11043.1 rRNA maturation RNase YbeY [Nitrospirota bacterium]HDZ01327.1 rRNA maturation RNase YbeY [Nitrospirota bacterium]